jgi:hypothetical protein
MKCISCSTDNNLKDRTANMGRCKSCNHQFVFEPTAMPTATKLTDPFFAKLLLDLSANNTLFFTPRQLYYLLDKRLRSNATKGGLAGSIFAILIGFLPILFISFWSAGLFRIPYSVVAPILFFLYAAVIIWSAATGSVSRQFNRRARQDNIKMLKILAGVLLLVGMPVSIIMQAPLGICASIGLGLGAAWLSFDRQRQQSKIFDEFLIDRGQFDTWLKQWTSVNSPPVKILPEPQTMSLPAAPDPEVTAYSFDRVVVCNSIEIAQLLITNNFHFENNCAILTIDGYPQSIFAATMTMLRRNPDLKVYALHDCSPAGVQMISHLRRSETWFPDPNIPIIDVGIMPRQVMNNADISTRQSSRAATAAQGLPADVRASLNPEEIAWLNTGCYLDLESFPPQQLIQILQRAINDSRELGMVESSDTLFISSYGSGDGFYAAESFG